MTAENKDKSFVEGPELDRREVKVNDRGEGDIRGNNPPNHEKVDIVYKQQEK